MRAKIGVRDEICKRKVGKKCYNKLKSGDERNFGESFRDFGE